MCGRTTEIRPLYCKETGFTGEVPEKAVVMVSGGVDSSTLCHEAVGEGYEVFPLTFIYGRIIPTGVCIPTAGWNSFQLSRKLRELRPVTNALP